MKNPKRFLSVIFCVCILSGAALGQIMPDVSPSTQYPTENIVTPSPIVEQVISPQYPASVAAVSQINSVSSGLWNAPGTWDCGCLPDMLDDVNILDGHDVELNLNTSLNHLDIQANASLTISTDADYTIDVYGDWNVSGEFNAGYGSVRFMGDSDQYITGTTAFYTLTLSGSQSVHVITDNSIINTLELEGSTLYPNGRLHFAGDENKVASISSVESGTIDGSISYETIVNNPSTAWLFLSSAVNNASFEEWDDEFVTTGFIGADYPNYPFVSLLQYYEPANSNAASFSPVDSVTQTIESGSGYYIFSNGGTFTVDVQGQPTVGNHTFDISYTDNDILKDDGLNLIGNPYLSTIDWDSEAGWTKSGVGGAIYVHDLPNSQYKCYANGYSVNGGSPLINCAEAFWVQTSEDSPILELNEAAKTQVETVETNTQDNYIGLGIVGMGSSDEVIVAFDNEATSNFDLQKDAQKFFSSSNLPNLAIRSDDDINLAINSLALDGGGIDIPIIVHSPSEGELQLQILKAPIMEHQTCISLEDLNTGISYDVFETDTFTFYTASVDEEHRFTLHIGESFNPSYEGVLCNGADDGSITVSGTGSGPWDYNWYDSEMTLIDSITGMTSALNLQGMSPGTYTVVSMNNDYCPSLGETITIVEPEALEMTNTVSHIGCGEEETGEIFLYVTGGTGLPSYDWSNDSQDSMLTNVAAGFYGVVVHDENGCLLSEMFEIEQALSVDALFETETPVVELSNGMAIIEFENLTTEADSYLWTFGQNGYTTTDEDASVSYTESGAYLVSMNAWNDECMANHQMMITVQEEIVGVEESQFSNSVELTIENGELYLVTNFSVSNNLEINGYNHIGQKIIQTIQGDYTNGKIHLPTIKKHITGIITVYNIDNGESISFKIIR